MSLRWQKILIYTLMPALAGIAAMWIVLVAGGANKFYAFYDAGISIVLFVLGAKVLANILRYYRPSEGREWNLAVWIAIINGAWLFGSVSLVFLVLPDYEEYHEDLVVGSLILRFFIAVVVLTCTALITWIRRQSESEAKSQNRFNEIQKLSKETELNALRQQLQPHFLFNSLNSIQALTTSDPARAKKMVLQLSDFLRGTLRKDNHVRLTVAEEIEHTRLYLEIEMVRFSDRLQLEWNLDEACFEHKIPALVLQPLVENAIKFGVYQTTGPVTIAVSVFQQDDRIHLRVENPIDASMPEPTKGTGFGLASLERRMYLIFGKNDLLETKKEAHTFRAELKIPITP